MPGPAATTLPSNCALILIDLQKAIDHPSWGDRNKPDAEHNAAALLAAKHTNNAFIGTDLESRLRAAGMNTMVIAGVVTNNSVEATVRMAGNLGFQTYLVEDASFTFARRGWNGVIRSADEVHAMSLANLDGEYCRVVKTVNTIASSEV